MVEKTKTPEQKQSPEEWVKDREVFREATPEGVQALFINWRLDNADRVRRVVSYKIKKELTNEYSMVIQFERKLTRYARAPSG